jgi:hypothetical protein
VQSMPVAPCWALAASIIKASILRGFKPTTSACDLKAAT